MRYRAITTRIAYIDGRLRHKQDYPSAADIAVRFDGEAASKIPERRRHHDQKVERLPYGGIIVRFRTNQQSQVLFWVSQWRPNAEILEPAGRYR